MLSNPVKMQWDYNEWMQLVNFLRPLRKAGISQVFDKEDPLVSLLQEYKRTNKMKTAGSYEDLLAAVEGKLLIASIKIDGVLTCIGYKDGKAKLVTLEGRIITDLPVTDEIEHILEGKEETIFIGELYGVDLAGKELPFNKTLSLVRKPESEADEKRIRVAVFDVLKYDGKDVSQLPYAQRCPIIEDVFGSGAYITPVYTKEGDESTVAALWKQKVLKEGREGIVVRTDGTYKLKPVQTADLAVIGMEISDRHPNWAGALLLAAVDNDGIFLDAGKVGTGLTLKDRRDWFKKIMDKKVVQIGNKVFVDPYAFDTVVEVKYKGVNLEGRNAWEFTAGKLVPIGKRRFTALRHPSLVRVREDKHVEHSDVSDEQIPEVRKGSLTRKAYVPTKKERLRNRVYEGSIVAEDYGKQLADFTLKRIALEEAQLNEGTLDIIWSKYNVPLNYYVTTKTRDKNYFPSTLDQNTFSELAPIARDAYARYLRFGTKLTDYDKKLAKELSKYVNIPHQDDVDESYYFAVLNAWNKKYINPLMSYTIWEYWDEASSIPVSTSPQEYIEQMKNNLALSEKLDDINNSQALWEQQFATVKKVEDDRGELVYETTTPNNVSTVYGYLAPQRRFRILLYYLTNTQRPNAVVMAGYLHTLKSMGVLIPENTELPVPVEVADKEVKTFEELVDVVVDRGILSNQERTDLLALYQSLDKREEDALDFEKALVPYVRTVITEEDEIETEMASVEPVEVTPETEARDLVRTYWQMSEFGSPLLITIGSESPILELDTPVVFNRKKRGNFAELANALVFTDRLHRNMGNIILINPLLGSDFKIEPITEEGLRQLSHVYEGMWWETEGKELKGVGDVGEFARYYFEEDLGAVKNASDMLKSIEEYIQNSPGTVLVYYKESGVLDRVDTFTGALSVLAADYPGVYFARTPELTTEYVVYANLPSPIEEQILEGRGVPNLSEVQQALSIATPLQIEEVPEEPEQPTPEQPTPEQPTPEQPTSEQPTPEEPEEKLGMRLPDNESDFLKLLYALDIPKLYEEEEGIPPEEKQLEDVPEPEIHEQPAPEVPTQPELEPQMFEPNEFPEGAIHIPDSLDREKVLADEEVENLEGSLPGYLDALFAHPEYRFEVEGKRVWDLTIKLRSYNVSRKEYIKSVVYSILEERAPGQDFNIRILPKDIDDQLASDEKAVTPVFVATVPPKKEKEEAEPPVFPSVSESEFLSNVTASTLTEVLSSILTALNIPVTISPTIIAPPDEIVSNRFTAISNIMRDLFEKEPDLYSIVVDLTAEKFGLTGEEVDEYIRNLLNIKVLTLVPRDLVPEDADHTGEEGTFLPKVYLSDTASELLATRRRIDNMKDALNDAIGKAEGQKITISLPYYDRDIYEAALKEVQIPKGVTIVPQWTNTENDWHFEVSYAMPRELGTAPRNSIPSRRFFKIIPEVEEVEFPIDALVKTIQKTDKRPLLIYVNQADYEAVRDMSNQVGELANDPGIFIAMDNSIDPIDNNRRFEVKVLPKSTSLYFPYKNAWEPTDVSIQDKLEEQYDRNVQRLHEIEGQQTPALVNMLSTEKVMDLNKAVTGPIASFKGYSRQIPLNLQMTFNNNGIEISPFAKLYRLEENVYYVTDPALIREKEGEAFIIKVDPNSKTSEVYKASDEFTSFTDVYKFRQGMQEAYNYCTSSTPSPEQVVRYWLQEEVHKASYPEQLGWLRMMHLFGFPVKYRVKGIRPSSTSYKALGISDAVSFMSRYTAGVQPNAEEIKAQIATLQEDIPEELRSVYETGWVEGLMQYGYPVDDLGVKGFPILSL